MTPQNCWMNTNGILRTPFKTVFIIKTPFKHIKSFHKLLFSLSYGLDILLDVRLSQKTLWKWKLLIMSNSLWLHGPYSPWNFPGQNTGVGRLFPFSRGSSQPRDWTQVSHTADRFLTSWATQLCTSLQMHERGQSLAVQKQVEMVTLVWILQGKS